jgi:hypothetical protein
MELSSTMGLGRLAIEETISKETILPREDMSLAIG